MVRIEMYNLQSRLVQFKNQKKLTTYLIARTELSLNVKKVKRPEIQVMVKFLEMSEICFVI